MTRPRRRALALALALSALAPAAAAAAPGDTVFVSRPSGFGALPFDGVSASAVGVRAVDGGGGWIAFQSQSDVLSDADDDRFQNVFVRHAVSHELRVVSAAADGTPANATSFGAAISEDGSRVAFWSLADNLVPGDTNGRADLFVKTVATGAIELVTRRTGADGAIQAGDASTPGMPASLDATGDRVAFATSGVLDPVGDTNDDVDVYVRDLGADTTTLASADAAGVSGGIAGGASADSIDPVLSDDGSRVVFRTAAPLAPTDFDGYGDDLYVRHLDHGVAADAIVRVADASSARQGLDLSGNGEIAAFVGYGAHEEIRLADVPGPGGAADAALDVVSLADGGATPANGRSLAPSLDDSGARIAFVSEATNLHPDDTDAVHDVYVRDRFAARTHLLSRDSGAAGAKHVSDWGFGSVALSGDGRRAAFDLVPGTLNAAFGINRDATMVWARDLPDGDPAGGATRLVSRPQGGGSTAQVLGSASYATISESGHAASAGGRYVVFWSGADALWPDAADDRTGGLYRRDLLTGETVLVTRASDGTPADAYSYGATISADGNLVAFASEATNLVPGDTNGATDIFVRDVAAGTTRLVSRTVDGAISPGGSYVPAISADGSTVAFATAAKLDPAHDGNAGDDVYAHRLADGATVLVSRDDGADAGNDLDAGSSDPRVSADGTRIAFTSTADTYDVIDDTSGRDVYVRDLETHQTILASRPDGAAELHPDEDSDHPAISADGRRVAFATPATNMGDGPAPNGEWAIHVRDLETDRTYLASRADGKDGAVGDEYATAPALNGDGTLVAFDTAASNLGEDPSFQEEDVFVRDLDAGTTRLVSRGPGADGAAATLESEEKSFSTDGSCLVFAARGLPAFGGLSWSPDWDYVFARALTPACTFGRPADAPGGDGPGGGGGGGGGGTPPAGAPVPPGSAAVDRTKPRVTRTRLARTRFAVGPRPTKVRAARVLRGTTVRFTLSERAAVQFQIRRRGAKRTLGTIRRNARKGAGKLAFSGRIGRRALKPGRYTLRVVATDRAGNVGRGPAMAFTIVRP